MGIRIAIIGEGMLELSGYDQEKHNDDGVALNLKYGGDTINTAVYLSRLGVNVSYISAVGDDPLSDWLTDEWRDEGVDCSMVGRVANSTTGIYMVSVANNGERSFHYWRKASPASKLFDDIAYTTTVSESMSHYDFVYLSGISLAILSTSARARLMDMLLAYKAAGGKVIFDGNYRPTLWKTQSLAIRAYKDVYRFADIALPTEEDEMALFGYTSEQEIVEGIVSLGVSEIILKMGERGCLAVSPNRQVVVPAKAIKPVDTTAAGDSFNAGFLAARLNENHSIERSCESGHKMASKVIQFPGAIIPKSRANETT